MHFELHALDGDEDFSPPVSGSSTSPEHQIVMPHIFSGILAFQLPMRLIFHAAHRKDLACVILDRRWLHTYKTTMPSMWCWRESWNYLDILYRARVQSCKHFRAATSRSKGPSLESLLPRAIAFCRQADHTKRADQVCLPDLARGGESVATSRLYNHRQGSQGCSAVPAAICRAPISRDGSRVSTRKLPHGELYLFRSQRRPPRT